MFPDRYFGPRYFARRYWARTSAAVVGAVRAATLFVANLGRLMNRR